MYRPELAAPAHAVVPAVCAVLHGVCVVVCVSVGNVEAEALLIPPLLSHQCLSMVAGQAVLFLQAAQRQPSVDRLEDNGSYHLKCRDRKRENFSKLNIFSSSSLKGYKTFINYQVCA